jgi:hypothetical protein
VLLLAVVTFAPAWGGEFVLDDVVAISQSACVGGSPDRALDLGRIFGSNFCCEPGPGWSIETWRPWTVAWWWVAWTVGGGATWAFDLLNLTLFGACAVTLLHLARELGATDRAALIAAGCFSVLAIHTDAVASHVGAAELWSTLFTFLAMRAALRAGVDLILWCALAVMAKESGALAVPLVIVVAVLGPRSETPRRSHALATIATLASLLVLVARAEVLGGWRASHIPAFVNPLVDAGFGARLVVGLDLIADYTRLTFIGTPLAADYAFDSIGVGEHADVIGAAAGGLAVLAVATLAILRRGDPLTRTTALWWLGCSAFVSNIAFVLPALFAERMWLLGSAAMCVSAGAGVDVAMTRWPARARVIAVGVGVFAAIQLALSWQHALAWRTPATIIDATLEANPRNARALQWRASEAFGAGRVDQAGDAAQRVLAIRPDATEALVLVAITDDLGGRAPRALNHFRRALKLAPGDPGVAAPFIQFLLEHGNTQQARFVYQVHASARGGAAHPTVPMPPGPRQG